MERFAPPPQIEATTAREHLLRWLHRWFGTTPLSMKRDVERRLRGKELTESSIDRLCQLAVRGASPLRDNGYKVALVKVVLARALRQAAEA